MARKSKVPTPAELARLYAAGHDALTAALDAGCLPADLQNKWPNLPGTLRRVEGQPYHHPWLKDPLTDDAVKDRFGRELIAYTATVVAGPSGRVGETGEILFGPTGVVGLVKRGT